MFNDTIMQNIRYGRPEATDGEVLEAARLARLDVAVAKMPKAFQTGEGCITVSGLNKGRRRPGFMDWILFVSPSWRFFPSTVTSFPLPLPSAAPTQLWASAASS